MKKLILLVLLTIPFFLFINTNYTSATNSLDIIDDYFLDNNIVLNEDYQNGYRQGYEDGFSHKNRVKVELWSYSNIRISTLNTVYRFIFENFVQTYNIISPQNLTTAEIRNKVFIPTFIGYVGNQSDNYLNSYATDARQWYLGTLNFLLYVEKEIIDAIMLRDNVNEITAFRTYLQENNIYGYFERANGLTDYQIGYNTGYNEGFNTAMKKTTTKLMSSVLLLIGPILLINITLLMLKDFKTKD